MLSKTLTTAVLAATLLLGNAGSAQAHVLPGHTTVNYTVVAHEDGSGWITRTVRHVGQGVVLRTVVRVSEGLLPWECDRMGDRRCGARPAPMRDARTKTVTLVIARRPGMPHPVALTWSTDGTRSARIATDVDAEGEVV